MISLKTSFVDLISKRKPGSLAVFFLKNGVDTEMIHNRYAAALNLLMGLLPEEIFHLWINETTVI